jgi:uncharacterized membrane protein
LAIGTFLVYQLIMHSVSVFSQIGDGVSVGVGLVPLIFGGPLSLGAAIFSLSIARNQDAKFEQLFEGFKNFSNALLTYLLMILIIVLFTFLLIIPGIIRALAYAMTFYILADEPNLKAKEALDKSLKMMDGHKMRLFNLFIRFFLLSLLCILTLGIGFLWLIPYVNVTLAKFYEDIKSVPSQFV